MSSLNSRTFWKVGEGNSGGRPPKSCELAAAEQEDMALNGGPLGRAQGVELGGAPDLW